MYIPLATAGPLAFQVLFLVQTSMTLARMRGQQDTLKTLEYKSNAMRTLRSYLQKTNSHLNDEVLTTVLAMAEGAKFRGSTNQGAVHMKAAMAMIRQQGGPYAIEARNIPLAKYIYWYY